jgi:hypothetical protein
MKNLRNTHNLSVGDLVSHVIHQPTNSDPEGVLSFRGLGYIDRLDKDGDPVVFFYKHGDIEPCYWHELIPAKEEHYAC